jgi:hypothetical protein
VPTISATRARVVQPSPTLLAAPSATVGKKGTPRSGGQREA